MPTSWPAVRDLGTPGAPSPADGPESIVSISDDGRIAASGGFSPDLYDTTTGLRPTGIAGLAGIISGDGRYVAAASFVQELATGTTRPLSYDLGGGQMPNVVDLSSNADVAVAFPFAVIGAVYAGRIDATLPSVSAGLPAGNATSAAVSGDGRYVVFAWRPGADGGCLAGPTACPSRVYRVDLATGERIEVSAAEPAGSANAFVTVSSDGRYVAWLTGPAVAGAAYDGYDAYDILDLVLVDVTTGARQVLLPATTVGRQLVPRPLSMSLDGQRLAVSRDAYAVGGHTQTVVIVDTSTRRVHEVVRDTNGTVAAAWGAVLSGDGSTLAFTSPVALTADRQRVGMSRSTYGYVVDVRDLAATDPTVPELTGTEPTRLVDTRVGTGGRTTPLAAGDTLVVPVTGTNNVPTDATDAVMNVTAVDTRAPGFLTVYPCGTERPTASNVNYTAGQVIPNLTITKTGTNGTICIYTHQTADLVVDLSGWFPAA